MLEARALDVERLQRGSACLYFSFRSLIKGARRRRCSPACSCSECTSSLAGRPGRYGRKTGIATSPRLPNSCSCKSRPSSRRRYPRYRSRLRPAGNPRDRRSVWASQSNWRLQPGKHRSVSSGSSRSESCCKTWAGRRSRTAIPENHPWHLWPRPERCRQSPQCCHRCPRHRYHCCPQRRRWTRCCLNCWPSHRRLRSRRRLPHCRNCTDRSRSPSSCRLGTPRSHRVLRTSTTYQERNAWTAWRTTSRRSSRWQRARAL
jgi:hypothetical protein